MKLIKILDKRLSKNGKNLESWGLFWCDFCKSEVEKRLRNGLKDKSCGCVRKKLISESEKGRVFSFEERQKISEANKGKIRTEENKQKISETIIKNGTSKGENNPFYGKKHTERNQDKK